MNEPIHLMIERQFSVPIEQVFNAFTQAKHLKQWFLPKGFSLIEASFNAKEGQDWFIKMKSPGGDIYHAQGTYLSIQPHHTLVFTHQWRQNATSSEDLSLTAKTTITVNLSQVGNKTCIRFKQVGFANLEQQKSHQQGWCETFDKLKTLLLT